LWVLKLQNIFFHYLISINYKYLACRKLILLGLQALLKIKSFKQKKKIKIIFELIKVVFA
jgi:hypothetical protein